MYILRNDLSNCLFVASPADTYDKRIEHYTNDFRTLPDKHAPEIINTVKDTAQWLSVPYANAKAISLQFERTWHKNKTPTIRARLRRQIGRCNAQVNKDKARFYKCLINENGHNFKKL